MTFDADDEILQDFLIEAGEILEHLSEQLVELENNPGDKQLLNAIFRGFHTVKGGAGFLQLEALVNVCHAAENIFDMLRNDKLALNAEVMDVILQALDAVNSMFRQVQGREEPAPASPALIDALHRIASGTAVPTAPIAQAATKPVTPPPPPPPPPPPSPAATSAVANESSSDAITDDEFEALMDALHGGGAPGKTNQAASIKPEPVKPAAPVQSAAPASDEISEDEFEALLDQLQGQKQTQGSKAATDQTVKAASAPSQSVPAAASSAGDHISEDEFEALLDQLHGSGKAPAVAVAAPASAPVRAASPPAMSAPAASSPVSASVPSPAPVAHAPEVSRAADPNAHAAHQVNADMMQETTVRVDTKRLDDIMNMVGELVLVRNRLVRLGISNADEEISKAVANLDVVTADLQMAVMKTRMQPIKKVFGRFPRVVRDLARNLKKEVELELVGEETDLDKNLVEALADPLVHLVRNAVDHGVEAPAVRESHGKSRVGKIVLSAQQEGDHIVLSITDDGAGMDPDKLRAKAVEKGLMDEDTASRLSENEAFNLIFAPGFSTKDEISDVSGRGVGMDVVKTKIAQLNGTVDVRSVRGQGSVIAIKVPLTLAIMPTLMIMLGQQTFALPLVSVNEIFHMDVSKKNIVDGQDVIVVREKALPLFYLKRWLIADSWSSEPDGENAHVVIVTVGTKKVGFVVDQLIGQEEVVIKPLGAMLQGTPGIAGATITGDGRIAMILDVPSMLKHYAHRM